LGVKGGYDATTHTIAGFRGKVPGKGMGKGRGREKGRVMEGRGWRGRERMERRGRKEGDLLHGLRGLDAPV